MKISQLFQSDVTRDIPPVIYFHEQKPEKLQAEVSEYIITGGYEDGDPRKKRIAEGIHEQYVHLLTALTAEMNKRGGAELPACWISGFYGSGKSSFAKLIGLALDNRALPNGKNLAEALLARDDSPRRQEFHEAWKTLREPIDSMAVVFDIGAVARDDEQIHTAVKRQLQERLEYCPESHYVADYELKLEQDGRFPEFLTLAEEALGKPWSESRKERMAEDHFSAVMNRLMPSVYDNPVAWLDSRAGEKSGAGTAVEETVRDIEAMLQNRAPGKTLFVVVDEVSQYIYGNDGRMLKLQTFVEALGQRLRGRAWLLATGQQKLEEDLEGGNLGKLKDRFPPRLRVHLAPTNIRDVVHKRLLKKAPDKEQELQALFEQHRADLKLYGYQCENITSTDFIEVYPMLPGHVDLLMQITSNLRARSSRMKGDDHAIRGLLQLLGELFRELSLGEQPVGSLLTIDQIYDVQHTALDADVQNTMARLTSNEELAGDEVLMKAAKAVALLELVQEQEATTPELVARCLYPRLGAGSQVEAYARALEKLAEQGFLSRSEKQGYKIQSSAGQEWMRERDSYGVTAQALSELVRDKLKELMGQASRPKYKARSFPVAANFSDGRQSREERLVSPNDPANVAFDFYYLTRQEDRKDETWLKDSDTGLRRDRIIWVSGAPSHLEQQARELIRSRQIVGRYDPRQGSLVEAKRRLLYDERTRLDHLEEDITKRVAACFLEGELYFRARKLPKETYARNFPSVVQSAAEEVLPGLYPHFIDMAVSEGDMKQLLEHDLRGVSNKFLASGLGILEEDAGKFVATCTGVVPTRIKEFVAEHNGVSGQVLLTEFGGPPCGYAPDVVRACVLGLLRGSHITIRPESGAKITSVRDADVLDIFRKDRDFKQADILPGGGVISQRMRVSIRRFLQESLNLEVEPDNDHLADAVFNHFPACVERLQDLQRRFNRLPRQPEIPKALEGLQSVLAKCVRSRLVEDTLLAVTQNLDTLREGMQLLGLYSHDLTEARLEHLKRVDRVRAVELEQLAQVGLQQEVARDWHEVEKQLDGSKPWLGIDDVTEAADRIRTRYVEARRAYLDKQEELFEELRGRVVRREGYNTLDADQADNVLRPLREARCDTTEEAISPPLAFLRDSVPNRLKEALEESNRRMDEFLDHVVVVQVKIQSRGREFGTVEEVEAWISELRGRLLDQLKPGVRVRLT